MGGGNIRIRGKREEAPGARESQRERERESSAHANEGRAENLLLCSATTSWRLRCPIVNAMAANR